MLCTVGIPIRRFKWILLVCICRSQRQGVPRISELTLRGGLSPLYLLPREDADVLQGCSTLDPAGAALWMYTIACSERR